MNKRILHLLNKAGFHQPEMERLGLEQSFDKFAELIIQECINIIHQQERIPKEFFYAKPAHQHEYAIKNYFGLNDE